MNFIAAKDAPLRNTGQVKLHDAAGFAGMRKAGMLAGRVLDALSEYIVPGVSTDALNSRALSLILDGGGVPAPLYYRGFTKAICTSINHVVCHGIPSDRVLREGDIMNVDVTVIVDGWHGDHSRMYALGEISARARRLIDTTYAAMMRGIELVRPGVRLGDIGAAIEAEARLGRFSVVRDFCGHGLGRVFHDTPNILHYGRAGEGLELCAGMFFTIEPMLNLGRADVKILRDGWTAVTRDRTLSAQFEHSLGVTHKGYEIFTLSDDVQKNQQSKITHKERI